jgi:hypothetical protein
MASQGLGGNAGSCTSDADCVANAGTHYICNASACTSSIVTLATSGGYGAIVVDAVNVYWTDDTNDSIDHVPIVGGTVSTFGLGNPPQGVAVSSGEMYFTGFNDPGTVASWPISPTGRSTPQILAQNQGSLGTIVVTSQAAFWVDESNPGTVTEYLFSGATPTPFASGQNTPMGLAVDATNVYWTNEGDGTVMKKPLAGGNATMVASGQNEPRAIAVDATSAYWVNAGSGGTNQDGAVMKAPLGGGTAIVLAPNQSFPYSIAVDASNVYWTTVSIFTAQEGGVFKLPLNGGVSPIPIQTGQTTRAVAVDAASVYWLTDSAVMRAPK